MLSFKKYVLMALVLGVAYNAGLYGMESGKNTVDENLMRAVSSGNINTVEALLAQGANVNFHSFDGRTPLMAAAKGGRPEDRANYDSIAKLLMSRGADVNSQNKQGNTALMFAAGDGNVLLCKLLIEHGAKTNAKSKSEYTPLLFATTKRHAPAALIILQATTKLTTDEMQSVKNWLLVDQRLRHEGRNVHKDLKVMVVHNIFRSLANDLRDRVIQAGALKALELEQTKESRKSKAIIELLEQYLDPNFLEGLVREQTMLPKRAVGGK